MNPAGCNFSSESLAPDKANHLAGANLDHACLADSCPLGDVTNTGPAQSFHRPYVTLVRIDADLSARSMERSCYATFAGTTTECSSMGAASVPPSGYRGIGTRLTSRCSSSNPRLAHGLEEVKRPEATTRQSSRSSRLSSSRTSRRA
jgi:hypothetical protein